MPRGRHRDESLLALGQAVRQVRRQRGLSAEQLADALGLSRRSITAIETGRLDPSYDLLLTLAEGLGLEPSALVALAEQLRGAGG